MFVALTFVLAIVAGPLEYAGEIVRNEDRFVAVTDRVLSHPDVRRAVAAEVTTISLEALRADEAIAELLPGASRSLAVPITSLASRAVTDAAFTILDTEPALAARDTALREVHRQLTADSGDVTLDLRAVIARTTRELAGPTAGSAATQLLVKSDDGRFTISEEGSTTANIFSAMRALPAVGRFHGVATLVSLAMAVVVAMDRRRALVRAGLALAAGAVVSVVLVAVALLATTLLTQTPLGPEVGRGLAESLASDFSEQQRGGVIGGFVLATLGLLLGGRPSAVAIRTLPSMLWARDRVGVTSALSNTVTDNPPLARLVAWIGPALLLVAWRSPTGRVVATVLVLTLLLQLAIWLFSSPDRAAARAREWLIIPGPSLETVERAEATRLIRANLAVVVVLVFLFWPGWSSNIVVGFFTVGALVQAVLDIRPARQLARLNAVPDIAVPLTPRFRRRGYVLAGVAVVAVMAGVVLSSFLANDVAAADVGCNGHVELCDRPIDEIVWAGSHNSMSSSDIGWELAAQTGDMVAQLDHGVRALLIDIHYWDEGGAFEGSDDSEVAALIEAALEGDTARPGTWLCHGPCALGATDLVSGLTDIALWLEENPREVVMFVVQDEISARDAIDAFDVSGLADIVHDHRPGTSWPTLGELIDSGERVLVYAENEGTPDSWYQNAWEDTFFDTPFKFDVQSDFACSPGRGNVDNALFLVNHWLTTGVPLPEAAKVVNSSAVLRERVDSCVAELGRRPTVIAVDFVQTGDLVSFVAELNDVDSEAT